MTRTEFQQRVVTALQLHSEALVSVLRRLVDYQYPPEMVRIDFEVFADGFTSGFPVRAFFMDETNTEYFLIENGQASYPSPVDPGLLKIPRVYDSSLEQRLSEADTEADSYTLAGLALIPWFAQCWRAAGGLGFSCGATIRLHDDPRLYDLVDEQWLDA